MNSSEPHTKDPTGALNPLDKQIETFCPVSGDVDQSNAIEMLTNLEHMYSHASTSITVLSKIMSVNNILVEEEF